MSDRTRADGQYQILGAAGSEFIVTDGVNVFHTGQQMVVDKLVVEVGSMATSAAATINFSDEPALPKLQELQAAYPEQKIYLSGAIALDFPEEVSLPIDPKVYPTATLAGDMLTLEYHPLDKAVLQLRDQYAVGTLQVKAVQ